VVHQGDRRQGQGRRDARGRRLPCRALRHHRVRADQLRRRGRALRDRRPGAAGPDRARRDRAAAHLRLPRRPAGRQRQGAVPRVRRGVLHLDGRRRPVRAGPGLLRHADHRAQPVRLAQPADRGPRQGHLTRAPVDRRPRRGDRDLATLRRRAAAAVLPGRAGRAVTSSTTTVATAPEAVPTGPRPQRSTPPLRRTVPLRTRWQRDRSLVVMTLPALLLLGVFAYVPMAGNIVAWQDYSPYVGIAESPFVAWDNFARVLGSPAFLHAVRNTLVITGFQLVFYFPIPIALALLLNSVLTPAIRTTIQSIVYLPHFFSWVLVVTIFQQMFGGAGLVNQILTRNGWGSFDLMTNPDTFLLLITSQAIWKDAGWGIIIFLAALSTVDPALYEASVVDGANRWRRMWHITLPALRPVVVLLLILRL